MSQWQHASNLRVVVISAANKEYDTVANFLPRLVLNYSSDISYTRGRT